MVGDIDAPASTWIHTPTFVTAVVRELRGDVGARATCVLDIDDVPVDAANGIWVDAGGMVTCAFAYTFTTTGDRSIRVRVADVDPFDDDPSNDAASATVRVVVELPLNYTASADSGEFSYWSKSSYYLKFGGFPPPYSEYRSDSTSSRDIHERSSLSAWTREPLRFPEEPLTDVRLSQETGGATVHEASWATLPADSRVVTPDSSKGCVARNSGGSVVSKFTLCTRRNSTGSYTTLSYEWNAGDVTYVSEQRTIYTCNPPMPPNVCLPSSYYFNSARTLTGTFVPFGTTFAFDMAFTSGTSVFTARPVLPLYWSRSSGGVPWTCVGPWPYPALTTAEATAEMTARPASASGVIVPMASETTCNGSGWVSSHLQGSVTSP
jgi:hypothetical protein